jgi:hypothetical protein
MTPGRVNVLLTRSRPGLEGWNEEDATMKMLSAALAAATLTTGLAVSAAPADAAATRCCCCCRVVHRHVLHRAVPRQVIYRYVPAPAPQPAPIAYRPPPPPPPPLPVFPDQPAYYTGPNWYGGPPHLIRGRWYGDWVRGPGWADRGYPAPEG